MQEAQQPVPPQLRQFASVSGGAIGAHALNRRLAGRSMHEPVHAWSCLPGLALCSWLGGCVLARQALLTRRPCRVPLARQRRRRGRPRGQLWGLWRWWCFGLQPHVHRQQVTVQGPSQLHGRQLGLAEPPSEACCHFEWAEGLTDDLMRGLAGLGRSQLRRLRLYDWACAPLSHHWAKHKGSSLASRLSQSSHMGASQLAVCKHEYSSD